MDKRDRVRYDVSRDWEEVQMKLLLTLVVSRQKSRKKKSCLHEHT